MIPPQNVNVGNMQSSLFNNSSSQKTPNFVELLTGIRGPGLFTQHGQRQPNRKRSQFTFLTPGPSVKQDTLLA
jgi:hypothetical protein